MRKILLSLVFLAGAAHAAILFGNRGLIPLRPLIANHFISIAGD